MDFRKSIDTILHDRLASPFYGTFIISWLIWNWKIWYLTIFIDQDKILGTKLEFIVANYLGICDLLIKPLISTILLLTLFAYVNYLAYKISLHFERMKRVTRDKSEDRVLLSATEGSFIRKKLKEIESENQERINDKDKEIEMLLTEKSAIEARHSEVERELKVKTELATELQKTVDTIDFELMDGALRDYFGERKSVKEFAIFLQALQRGTINDPRSIVHRDAQNFIDRGFLKKDENGLYLTLLGRLYKNYFSKRFGTDNDKIIRDF